MQQADVHGLQIRRPERRTRTFESRSGGYNRRHLDHRSKYETSATHSSGPRRLCRLAKDVTSTQGIDHFENQEREPRLRISAGGSHVEEGVTVRAAMMADDSAATVLREAWHQFAPLTSLEKAAVVVSASLMHLLVLAHLVIIGSVLLIPLQGL